MNKQEIFNTVYRGLHKQGFQQSMDKDRCSYRGTDGRKCAIGFLIPDDIYHDGMECQSVSGLWNDGVFGMTEDEFFMRYRPLMLELQCAHDQHYIPEYMQRRLVEIAVDHGLDIPATIN